jgi:hypothetical protein
MIHVAKNGQQFGPFTLEQLNAEAAGRFAPTDLAWMDGWSSWQALSQVPGFAPQAEAPEVQKPVSITVSRNGEKHGPLTVEQLNADVAAGRFAPTDLAWMEGWSSWQALSEVPGFAPATAPPSEVPQVEAPTVQKPDLITGLPHVEAAQGQTTDLASNGGSAPLPPAPAPKPASIRVARNGEQLGAFTIDQVNAAVAAGRFAASDLAWMEGWSGWQPLSTAPGFQPFAPVPPAVQKNPDIHVAHNGQKSGPFTIDQVNAEFAAGRLTATDLVWVDGWPDWKPLSKLPGLRASGPPPAIPNQAPVIADRDAAGRLFVGLKYDYYAAKWAKLGGWNWAAFFLGVGWMAYRKMYRAVWIYFGAVVLMTWFEQAVGLPAKAGNVLNMAIAAVCGSQGNRWYQAHVEQKLREIAADGAFTDAVRLRLAKEGGTNLTAGILVPIGLVAALIALVAVVG